MVITYLALFFSLSLFADPKIQLLPSPKAPEDFEHQFKGCPENSECDQVMGMQMERWKVLVTKLQNNEMEHSQVAKVLEEFRKRYGIPSEFYTNKKSQQGFRPLYFNSDCKEHNPKGKEEERILKGISFIKSISADTAQVWRDQAQFEIKLGDMLLPQPVWVYFDDGPKLYQLPLEDQPLFIKKHELYILKEEDGLFYFLKVSAKGEWKVEDVDFSRLSEWQNKQDRVDCPKDDKAKASSIFGMEFCRSVWVEDQKKNVTVKMHRGCSI